MRSSSIGRERLPGSYENTRGGVARAQAAAPHGRRRNDLLTRLTTRRVLSQPATRVRCALALAVTETSRTAMSDEWKCFYVHSTSCVLECADLFANLA